MHYGVHFHLSVTVKFSILHSHSLQCTYLSSSRRVYPATPRHYPDQFCLLRLRCKFASARVDALPGNPCAPVYLALVGSAVFASSFSMLDMLAEIWSSLPVLQSIPGDWPPYSLLAVSSWNRHKVRIVSCIAELLQMLGLAFLELSCSYQCHGC